MVLEFMNKLIFFFFLFGCFFFSVSIVAQVKINDSTASIYQEIHELSKKSNFNKFVYKLLFRSSALKPTRLISDKKSVAKPVITHKSNGKIIRNITIETLDPFGQSVQNESKTPRNGLERFGNAVHLKTKEFTLRNLLLFKKNGVCDSILLKESERLIRSQRYVREVQVLPIYLTTSSDSMDVKIRVLDSWSLIPTGSLSANQSSAKLTERNIFGLGHQISGAIENKFAPKEQAVFGRYTIHNLKNSFVKFEVEYAQQFNANSKRSVSLSRPFYSVFARNAGGVYFENSLKSEFFPVSDTLIAASVKYELQDYWYGRAFKLNKHIVQDEVYTNLITAISYNRKSFLQTPNAALDPSAFFATEANVIGYVGLSKQQFYQDKYIFNYDIIEDIPYGENIALVVGHQNKNDTARWYTGITLSHGGKYDFGYVSSFIEWGSFYNKGCTEQTAFKMGLNYFSPLMHWGKWRFRQFIKPTYIWGNNRASSFKDLLTLNDYYGIEGFNNRVLGTQKWVTTFQIQSYVPGNWNGFRFSPYLNVSMGSLAKEKALFDSKVYSKFSVGVLINNDFLVFNSFQVSFSYYPSIPFEGTNILKTNSFENTDLTLNDFQLTKPAYIRYD